MYEDYNKHSYDPYETNTVTTYSSYEIPRGSSGTGGNGPGKKKKGSFFKKAVAFMLLGVLFGGSAAGGFFAVDKLTGHYFPQEQTKVSSTNVVNQPTAVSTESETQTITSDISGVVSAVMPSVVAITNMTREEIMSWWGQSFEQESEFSGSGIIIGQSDTEIFIVTNNHVISSATKLTVQFCDDELVEAQVKGTASDVDLAVIAVPVSGIKSSTLEQIKVATLGDSNELKVGEPAIAIGNALGYGQSVTTGIISALDREVNVEGDDYTLIQTDAAINPGNSGGALVNANGEVIGINSVKLGAVQVEGMGYAIPISSIKDVMDELMSRETKYQIAEEERGYLGIGMSRTMDITDELAAYYRLPQGVYVGSVFENTGAAAAGIKEADIITAINGEKVTSSLELQEQLQYYKAGTTIEVTIQRASENSYGYEELKLQVTLGKKPQ